MIIDRQPEKTIITFDDNGFLKGECIIGDCPTGNNSESEFSLILEEMGQCEKGSIKMYGPIERGAWIKILKQIIIELQLIN